MPSLGEAASSASRAAPLLDSREPPSLITITLFLMLACSVLQGLYLLPPDVLYQGSVPCHPSQVTSFPAGAVVFHSYTSPPGGTAWTTAPLIDQGFWVWIGVLEGVPQISLLGRSFTDVKSKNGTKHSNLFFWCLALKVAKYQLWTLFPRMPLNSGFLFIFSVTFFSHKEANMRFEIPHLLVLGVLKFGTVGRNYGHKWFLDNQGQNDPV